MGGYRVWGVESPGRHFKNIEKWAAVLRRWIEEGERGNDEARGGDGEEREDGRMERGSEVTDKEAVAG